MKVKDIMTGPAVYVYPQDTVFEAAKVMQTNNIGSVPVMDARNGMVGIVTDRDIIIRDVARGIDPHKMKVEEIMTTHVETVSPADDVKKAARKMAKKRVRRLPVMEQGELVGMVALGDMAIAKDCFAEASEALADISTGCHQKYPKAEGKDE
ncbi:MAG: CBS domain-containing protein [Ruminococcaceae bacterium]|nr:CBS domain-containing protein [Oscillospiraceae bacterium]